MMKTVKNNAHPVTRGSRSSSADKEERKREYSPATTDPVADAKERFEETKCDGEYAEGVREPDARWVTVADNEADKVGMGGAEEEIPDVGVDRFKDVRVGCFTGGLDGANSQLRGQIEFSCALGCEERDNHRVDLPLAALSGVSIPHCGRAVWMHPKRCVRWWTWCNFRCEWWMGGVRDEFSSSHPKGQLGSCWPRAREEQARFRRLTGNSLSR